MTMISPKIVCPNGWTDCEDCTNLKLCRAGLYRGEKDILDIAAEISQKVVHKTAVESANKIKGMSSKFDQDDPSKFMTWWYGWKVQGLHYKEPIPLDGDSAPGGGSKSKNSKKQAKKMPEYLKEFAH